jgi:hypothetical protein
MLEGIDETIVLGNSPEDAFAVGIAVIPIYQAFCGGIVLGYRLFRKYMFPGEQSLLDVVRLNKNREPVVVDVRCRV